MPFVTSTMHTCRISQAQQRLRETFTQDTSLSKIADAAHRTGQGFVISAGWHFGSGRHFTVARRPRLRRQSSEKNEQWSQAFKVANQHGNFSTADTA
jgi:hypothetical protein